MSTKKPIDEPSTPKVQGPASYFPSIERTYGHSVDHWFEVLAIAGNKKHMELVSVLKTQHGIGHGHANAIVSHWLANR
jgi:hypothetical protein